MAKNKEEKLDDLEIISIGKLYSGPWEKKYWSSSRAKDRYPYPIGYKTSRTLNGVNYKMEILEGLKGPLFVIMSTDGNSCSAQTPDIAWESFQKKSSSRIKLLPGKRFSCKIGGVEFFGFKNSFVQRLLRELVANVGGTAEQSSSLSSFLTRAPHTVHEIPSTESNKHLDLLPSLPKQRVTGKRSRKAKSVHKKPLYEATFKCQTPNRMQNVDDANPRQRDKGNCDGGSPSSFDASNKACGSSNGRGGLKRPNLAGVVEKEQCQFSAQGEMQSDVMDISDHLKLGDLPLEREVIRSEHHFSTKADSRPECDGLPNQSITTEVHECNNSIPEEKEGDTLLQHDNQIDNVADLCAPDTLDVAGDTFSNSDPNKYVKASCNANDDTVATDAANSEVFMTDSLQEDETGTANVSSEGFDTDSVGEEIPKSMMTVLLPRALPLLKTFSRKRKKSKKPSEMPLNRSQNEKNTSIGDALNVKEHIENSDMEREKETGSITCAQYDSVLLTFGITESIVPDSFDSNGSRHTAANHHDLFPDTAKGHPASRPLNHYGHQTHDLPVSVDAEAESPVAAIAMRDHKRNLDSELKMAGNEDSREDISTTGVNLLGKTNSSMRHPAEKINVNSKQARVGGNSIITVPVSAASQLRSGPSTKHTICRDFRNVCPMEKSEASLPKKFHSAKFADIDNSMSYLQMPSTSCCSDATENKEMTNDLRLNFQSDSKQSHKPQDLLKRIACYNHPAPISTVLLQTKESEIYLCVVCCSLEQQSTLFVYKALKKAEKVGFPSFHGHAPIAFRFYKDAFGRDINVDSSRLQFTPDAQSLVLVNSIKTPFCREGKLDCSCACCTSEFSKKNAVKIVQVKTGYVTIETMLKTTEGVSCLLVCEPSSLMVAEEGGKLILWVMNSSWSAQEEENSLPTLDSMLPCLVELKRIPKSTVLVVGHNGFGEFGLWDIENHILVSKFSAPGGSVFQCVPVGMFRWQSKGEHKSAELVEEIMNATKLWFSGMRENHILPVENTDVAVWLLISTPMDPDSRCCISGVARQANVARCWRLALLVKNMVITGKSIDSGVAAVAPAGHGIFGRCDGLVYKWDLSTGDKLENLHHFKGRRVSCISTDNTDSGALAIASEGQLLVYAQS